MPLNERQEKHTALRSYVETQDLRWWHKNFRKTLSSVPTSSLAPPKDSVAMAKAYERALTMPLDDHQRRRAMLTSNVPASSAPDAQREVTEKAPTASRDRDDGASLHLKQPLSKRERAKLIDPGGR
jgi:trehalose-6-phosphate synthase